MKCIDEIINGSFLLFFRNMSSGAGSSGTGRGRGSSLADNKPENKEAKPNPKMSKALGTSAKRYNFYHFDSIVR